MGRGEQGSHVPRPTCNISEARFARLCLPVQVLQGGAAAANPASAYGGSAVGLGLSAAMGAGVTGAGTSPVGSGFQPQLTHAKQDGGTLQHVHVTNDQHSLTLPFEPVALAFKNVHYYVKHPNGTGELELLKASVQTSLSRTSSSCSREHLSLCD